MNYRPQELELELRRLLAPVELVCDAMIPDELVDEAESVIRPRCNSWLIEKSAIETPGTLVTYFVVRGSERYEFNGVWPQLGVTMGSSRAGLSFINALKRLGLPTFEREVAAVRARRFVAPMLIHGAFPTNVAHRLVERVEQELRRGLIDADEARRRMLRDPDIVMSIQRPATRLLEWVPDYANRLLDAVIDHIEDPSGPSIAQLPVHLQHALESNADRRQGLARVRPPFVDFQYWAGYGPELVTPTGSSPWRLQVREHTVMLAADERFEVAPDHDVSAELSGRRTMVWKSGGPWFFDVTGRLLPADGPLPWDCVALLPRRSRLAGSNGESDLETEEGVALSGQWSAYRSARLGLNGLDRLVVSSVDDGLSSLSRTVRPADRSTLEATTVDFVTGPAGTPVFSTIPAISAAGTQDDELTAWFAPIEGPSRFATLKREESTGTYPLAPLIGSGPASGALTVRQPGGSKHTTPLTVVPGLVVDIPRRPLGPEDRSQFEIAADAGALTTEGTVDIPPRVALMDLPVRGLPAATVRAHLPRVQWGLRSPKPSRLDLAAGVIRTEAQELITDPVWLIVRCGLPSQIGLELKTDGRIVQEISRRNTTSAGAADHHLSIDLWALRDTIRANASSFLELDLLIDGVRMPVLRCGDKAEPTERVWDSTAAEPVVPESDGATWSAVPWMEGANQRPAPTAGRSIDTLELRLRLAGDANAVVVFLRLLGKRAENWRLTEFPSGPSADEWSQLNSAADALWRLDGRRFRLFASDDLETRTRSWASLWREQLRRRSPDERSRIEQWLIGRLPPVDRLHQWPNLAWITLALPPRAGASVQWLPATVMYHCISVATGDDDSGPVVADVADLEPALLLETVAFLMQALRVGTRLKPPIPESLPDEVEQADQPNAAVEVLAPETAEQRRPPALSDSLLETDGHRLMILADPDTSPPAVRISQGGTAEFLARSVGTDGLFHVDLPRDLAGQVTIEFVADHSVLNSPGDGVELVVSESVADGTTTRPLSLNSTLAELQIARIDLLLDTACQAISDNRLHAVPIEELFDDEDAAARGLLRLAGRCDDETTLDRVAIAVLPSAMLFSKLVDTDADLRPVLQRSRLLYACLTARNSDAWRALDWPPSIHFSPTGAAADGLAGWARRLASTLGPIECETWRYTDSSTIEHHALLRSVIQHLTRHDVDESFIDLLVATQRMLSRDQLAPEAARLILTAHAASSRGTSGAVLAGVAAHLITRS